MKCIQDEIPFEIPESWMWVRLGNICEINLGFTYKPTYYSEGIPFLSVSNLKDNEIDYSNCNYISLEEYKKASYGSKPLKGDILFGRVGSIGRPQIVNVDFPFCIFVSLGFLRFFSFPIYNKYVLLYLNSNLFTKLVKNIAKGTGRINLNTGWLYTFLFPLPSINEQFNIVDKYESIYEKIKSLENIFDEKNNNKKLLKLKVLDYIFSPNSSYKSYYENKKLSEVSKITMGQSPKGEDITNNANKGCLEFHQGKLDFGELVINDSHKYAIKYNKIAEPGSILFSVRAPVGSINFTDRKIAIGRGLCSILPYDNMVDKKFLYYQLLYLKNYFVEKGTGSTFQAITVDVLRNSIIFICNIEMQKIIVKKIDKIFKLIDNM